MLQRAWATWQHSQQQPPASADSILTFSSEAAASEKAAALAAGYFPVPPPPRAEHMHPFGGMAGGEEDVGLELLMTALASLVIVGVWVLGILLWYKHCVERPPRLFCGACHCECVYICVAMGRFRSCAYVS